MAHLLGRAVGQPRRARCRRRRPARCRTCRRAARASSFFVQPATPNGGFCLTVASDSRSTNDVGDGLRDVDGRARRRVDRPVVIVLEKEHIAAAGAGLHVPIVDAVLDLRARRRCRIDERTDRPTARPMRAIHRVRRPVDRVGQPLPADRRDLLVRILAELHEAARVEVPRGEHVPLAIGSRVDLLPRHHVDVARVPDVDGRRLVGLLARPCRRASRRFVAFVSSFGFAARLAPSRPTSRRPRTPSGRRRTTRAGGTRRCASAGKPRVAAGRRTARRCRSLRPRQDRMRRPFVRSSVSLRSTARSSASFRQVRPL